MAEFEISRKENLEISENYTIEKPRDLKCENLISSKFEAVKIIKNSARVQKNASQNYNCTAFKDIVLPPFQSASYLQFNPGKRAIF